MVSVKVNVKVIVYRFWFKILLKILIHKQKRAESPMVSLAQGNTLRKSAF